MKHVIIIRKTRRLKETGAEEIRQKHRGGKTLAYGMENGKGETDEK